MICAVISSTAAVSIIRSTQPERAAAGPDWRRQYDEVSIKLDNLRADIVRSDDAEARQLDKARSEYTVVQSSVQTAEAAPVRAYDAAASYDSAATLLPGQQAGVRDAEVALDADGRPRVVTALGTQRGSSSRFYLDSQGKMFLVVRTSADGAGGENEDRWYFIDGAYVTFKFHLASDGRPTAPGEKARTAYFHTPETAEDIERLRVELREALDRTATRRQGS